ncbi:uncharacterized protein JCM15063_000049 [Sporobolomyces koalae]|uniref:uncharacterized protein n=1 Tax=Sporobolomyces koalae TaxID=500713 RepID=UPI003179F648
MSLSEIPPLPPFPSLKPVPNSTSAIDLITALLGSSLRVTVPSTSRQFIGTFVCIDPQGNLVLDQTREWEVEIESGSGRVEQRNGSGRNVGLVLIKRGIWGSIERLKSDEERAVEHAGTPGCTPS